MLTVYGIPNCSTVKKARKWLDDHAVAYRFHDFRKDGTDPERVRAWLEELGAERLINRRGTTWRNRSQEERLQLEGNAGIDASVAALCAHPALIKRPLLDFGDHRHLGFKESEYQALFA